MFILPGLFSVLFHLPDAARITIALLLIAPLAFFMGMPFPLGLGYVGSRAPGFIPWAWALNGFASVLSAVAATLLAIEFGFSVVIVLALLLYITAALVMDPSVPDET